MHSAFPRGVTRTAAKKHSQTRPLLLGGKKYLQKACFQKSATSQSHPSREAMDSAYDRYSPLKPSGVQSSRILSATPKSSLKSFWYSRRKKPFLWLMWPIFQHQLSTVIHGACQEFYLSRLQHIVGPCCWLVTRLTTRCCVEFFVYLQVQKPGQNRHGCYNPVSDLFQYLYSQTKNSLGHTTTAWRQCIVSLRFTLWFSATVGDSIIYKNLFVSLHFSHM